MRSQQGSATRPFFVVRVGTRAIDGSRTPPRGRRHALRRRGRPPRPTKRENDPASLSARRPDRPPGRQRTRREDPSWRPPRVADSGSDCARARRLTFTPDRKGRSPETRGSPRADREPGAPRCRTPDIGSPRPNICSQTARSKPRALQLTAARRHRDRSHPVAPTSPTAPPLRRAGPSPGPSCVAAPLAESLAAS
jgi:hypothetical protein